MGDPHTPKATTAQTNSSRRGTKGQQYPEAKVISSATAKRMTRRACGHEFATPESSANKAPASALKLGANSANADTGLKECRDSVADIIDELHDEQDLNKTRDILYRCVSAINADTSSPTTFEPGETIESYSERILTTWQEEHDFARAAQRAKEQDNETRQGEIERLRQEKQDAWVCSNALSNALTAACCREQTLQAELANVKRYFQYDAERAQTDFKKERSLAHEKIVDLENRLSAAIAAKDKGQTALENEMSADLKEFSKCWTAIAQIILARIGPEYASVQAAVSQRQEPFNDEGSPYHVYLHPLIPASFKPSMSKLYDSYAKRLRTMRVTPTARNKMILRQMGHEPTDGQELYAGWLFQYLHQAIESCDSKLQLLDEYLDNADLRYDPEPLVESLNLIKTAMVQIDAQQDEAKQMARQIGLRLDTVDLGKGRQDAKEPKPPGPEEYLTDPVDMLASNAEHELSTSSTCTGEESGVLSWGMRTNCSN